MPSLGENEMKPKLGLPQGVRLSEWLGVTGAVLTLIRTRRRCRRSERVTQGRYAQEGSRLERFLR